jgi:hypothetical protein
MIDLNKYQPWKLVAVAAAAGALITLVAFAVLLWIGGGFR